MYFRYSCRGGLSPHNYKEAGPHRGACSGEAAYTEAARRGTQRIQHQTDPAANSNRHRLVAYLISTHSPAVRTSTVQSI